MTGWHRLARRVRWWLFGLLATLAIVAAATIGVMRLAVLPWLQAHPQWIAAQLGQMLHRPVTVERVVALWERSGPMLDLHGLRLIAPAQAGSPAQTLEIANAGIKINFLAWARRNAGFTELRLSGIDLDIVRDADGSWQLPHGFASGGDDDGQQTLDDNVLYGLGAIVLREVRLVIDDRPNGKRFRLAADELRLVNRGDFHRVLARVRNLETDAAPVDAVVEYDSGRHSGRLYAGGEGIDLAAVLRNYPVGGLVVERGGGKAQVWAWFADGRIDSVRAEVDLNGLVLATKTAIALDPAHDFLPHVGIDRLAFGARWRRQADGWDADVADLALVRQGVAAPPMRAHAQQRRGASGAQEYAGEIDRFDLDTATDMAMLVDVLPEGLRHWLYAADPEGWIERADLRYASAEDFDAHVLFDAVAWHGFDKRPGVTGLSGEVFADAQAFDLELPPHNLVTLSIPHVLREPIALAELSGGVAAFREDGLWRIQTDALRFESRTPGKTFGGELRGTIELPPGKLPSLDLSALVTHGEVPAAKLFWPINILQPTAVAWLDHALDGGRVAGRAVFRGDLADWPFRDNAGRFHAHAEVEDMRLPYLTGWPALDHAHGVVDFLGTGLIGEMDAGNVQGIKVGRGRVAITDFDEGTLDVAASAQGAGRDLLGFVKASPLGARFAGPLDGVEVGGQGQIGFALHAPMKPIEHFVLDGTVQLAGADLVDRKYGLSFAAAEGLLHFDRDGFHTEPLAVTFNGRPAKFSLAVGDHQDDPRHVVESRLETRAPVREVLAYAPALDDYRAHFSGEADWVVQFSADRDAPDGAGQRLVLASDLRGVAIDLPAPLAKPAGSSVPLSLTLGLPFPGADLDLRLGTILAMRARLPGAATALAANVQFGGDAPATLPKAGMAIGGAAPSVDLSGWMRIGGASGGGGDLLRGIDLHAASLLAWDRELGEGRVRLDVAADALKLGFDGTNIAGTLTIPRQDLARKGIDVDLARLYWPTAPDPEPGEVGPEDGAADAALDPAAIPPLRIRVGDFHLGKVAYGEATLTSAPIASGMRFDRLTTHSHSIDLHAHGDWTRIAGQHRSTFGIDLTAQDFGAMLDAFGYGGKLAGGRVVAHIDASWAGTPSNFAISRINGGALRLDIADGRIPDLDTGAGRLAGLLNLAAIPRRLAFDFGDLFNKGYSFDKAEGTFTFTDGYAYTDGFEVKSPTADMRMRGSIGLKTSDWNLTVGVTPHIGNTLFIGAGALIGGPPGAGVGALLSTILKKPINAATGLEYQVTGSWDKPDVVRVSSAPSKKTAGAQNAKNARN